MDLSSSESEIVEEPSGSESDSEIEYDELLSMERAGSTGPGRRTQTPIYNIEELHKRLEKISWVGTSFRDTQTVASRTDDLVIDIEDDLQRELCFYNQALSAAKLGVSTLQANKVAWLRPPDYYAEMVKSDQHMAKIRNQLLYEQKSIEESEARRKQRQAKKASKEVQAQKLKEKAQARKQNIAQVDRLRKQRRNSNFAGELDMDAELAKMSTPQRNAKTSQRLGKSRTPFNPKREAKNSKFGFGGRKRLGKQNDASSTANMESYKAPSARSKAKGGKRPGKLARAAAARSRR